MGQALTDRVPKRLLALIGLLVFYGMIGLTYVVATPVFKSPDEDLHVRYIQYLVENRTLPHYEGVVLSMRQEASQPPLYYALAALATGWIDYSDFDSVAQPYAYATIGRADIPGNRNAFVHVASRVAHPDGHRVGCLDSPSLERGVWSGRGGLHVLYRSLSICFRVNTVMALRPRRWLPRRPVFCSSPQPLTTTCWRRPSRLCVWRCSYTEHGTAGDAGWCWASGLSSALQRSRN